MQLHQLVNMFGNDLQRRYGEKIHKLSLHGGFSCPNRDGTRGRGGCTFCHVAAFSDPQQQNYPIAEQLAGQVAGVDRAKRYLAYFQAYTSTYAEVQELDSLYRQALSQGNIAGLCVGTRSDCVPSSVLNFLAGYREGAMKSGWSWGIRAHRIKPGGALTATMIMPVTSAPSPWRKSMG